MKARKKKIAPQLSINVVPAWGIIDYFERNDTDRILKTIPKDREDAKSYFGESSEG